MIDDAVVQDEITRWQPLVERDENLFELAFFKIFVKFETFLTNSFVKYAIGEPSKSGYTPLRKLSFINEIQLREVVTVESQKKYFDLLKERIEILAINIFQDNENNPFFLSFNDAQFSTNFENMRLVRHFIAHESDESKQKYVDKVLKGFNKSTFISLKDFFQIKQNFNMGENKKKQMSIYDVYTFLLSKHAEIIANGGGIIPIV